MRNEYSERELQLGDVERHANVTAMKQLDSARRTTDPVFGGRLTNLLLAERVPQVCIDQLVGPLTHVPNLGGIGLGIIHFQRPAQIGALTICVGREVKSKPGVRSTGPQRRPQDVIRW